MIRTILQNGIAGIDVWSVIAYVLSSLAVILLTLPVHEWAHAFTATRLGDPTPRWQGRLSVNPFAHIDWLGAACILLFGFGWARPVQINASNFRNPKVGMAITALAGPVSNIIMALIALILMNVVVAIFGLSGMGVIVLFVYMFFFYVAQINISLAVFNLIPIPPLDGSRLLAALLPNKQYYTLMRYERYMFFVVLALVWFGLLDRPLVFLSGRLMEILNFIAGLPFGFNGG